MNAPALAVPSGVFDTWAQVYDEQPNPLLMLEQRFLSQMLPDIRGLNVLDAGCGTGRWLQQLSALHPASVVGIDTSPEMLRRAAAKQGMEAALRLGSCLALPIQAGNIDLALASFVLSYLENLKAFAQEINRVTRPGATIFLTDMHPDTARTCNWKRSFKVNGLENQIQTGAQSLRQITQTFQACGFEILSLIEPTFGSRERQIFEQSEKLEFYESAAHLPAIYILQLRKPARLAPRRDNVPATAQPLRLAGARYALGPDAVTPASITVENGYIQSVASQPYIYKEPDSVSASIVDLTGYLLLPGLINAHDHLEFSLFPNLGDGPYENSTQWAEDIHRVSVSLIAQHCGVPKSVRLWWGAIRNLLCGVTTICHHNPLTRELLDPDFPVRVISKFGWAHSLSMDPNLTRNFDHTPPNLPFVLHAAEGVDAKSAQEIFDLDRMQVLNERTVLVHGLALTAKSVSLLNQRGVSLVICPTSNQFLFHCTPSSAFIHSLDAVVLGSDSPLTCAGDLLDEISFAQTQIGLDAGLLYEMVTSRSAKVLRLRDGEGHLRPGSVADLIAVRDQRLSPAKTIAQLTSEQVELVILSGRVQLVGSSLYQRLPDALKRGLQPLEIDGRQLWIRAPVDNLLAEAQKVLGNNLRLGGKRVDRASAA